jgi:hypothetical protein
VEHDLDHDHGHATEPDTNDVKGHGDRDSTTLRQLLIGDLQANPLDGQLMKPRISPQRGFFTQLPICT